MPRQLFMPRPLFRTTDKQKDRDDLDQQHIPDTLREAFRKNREELSTNVKVEVQIQGQEWLITDDGNKKQYLVKHKLVWRILFWWHKLHVYPDVASALRKMCEKEDIKLTDNYKIQVRKKDAVWQIIDWGDRQPSTPSRQVATRPQHDLVSILHYMLTPLETPPAEGQPSPTSIQTGSGLPVSEDEPEQLQVYQITKKKLSYKIENLRDNREYHASRLPTLKETAKTLDREKLLLALYTEICSSWRELTEVRFKLLGLVPAVSVLILINLFTTEMSTQPSGAITATTKEVMPIARFGAAIFGLLITSALYSYEKRNSEFYNDLISRGRKIEEELDIDTGHFRGRLKPSKKWLFWIFPINIQHDRAINAIYLTSITSWGLAILYFGFSAVPILLGKVQMLLKP